VEYWSHDYDKKLRDDPEFKLFIDATNIREPLDPRIALTGGRTNAVKLLYVCKDDEKMDYRDVVSLYPFGQKFGRFPIGHPVVITENFELVDQKHEPYFGLIKCQIFPPRRLLHPVLPFKCGDKLLFPLCNACSVERRNDFCDHTEEERALNGTWVTNEVYKALEMGYTMGRIDEVWHYKESMEYDRKDPSTGLFTSYINCCLKQKIEKTGWPVHCKTEEDKDRFLQYVFSKEGLILDPSQIEKNNGQR
jgi:hypothetical protein